MKVLATTEGGTGDAGPQAGKKGAVSETVVSSRNDSLRKRNGTRKPRGSSGKAPTSSEERPKNPEELPKSITEGDEGEDEDCLDKVGMRRELNLKDSIFLLIGIISGSGIFISANGVLQYSGSVGLSLLVWVLSGIISLMGGFVYVELGKVCVCVCVWSLCIYVLKHFRDSLPRH